MPVNTISADRVSYYQGARYIAADPGEFMPKKTRPVQGYGDKGPFGWPCRAHQLHPRLDLVTPGKPVAIDCEGMILDGEEGDAKRGLGRFSAVDENENIIMDTFVYYPKDVPHRPDPQWLGLGVKYKDILAENGARPVAEVLKDVQAILDKSGIVVGHAIHNDAKMLRGVSFEKVEVRDTQQLWEYRDYAKRGDPSLKDLSRILLGRDIQGKGHSSVEDASATMKLYQIRKEAMERQQGRRISPQPANTPTESESASDERSSSNVSSNVATASSATTHGSSPDPKKKATPAARSVPTASSGQARLSILGTPLTIICVAGRAPGRVVALPNIARLARGRVFDYRTSRYI